MSISDVNRLELEYGLARVAVVVAPTESFRGGGSSLTSSGGIR